MDGLGFALFEDVGVGLGGGMIGALLNIMKTFNNLFTQIYDYRNLYNAFLLAQR